MSIRMQIDAFSPLDGSINSFYVVGFLLIELWLSMGCIATIKEINLKIGEVTFFI